MDRKNSKSPASACLKGLTLDGGWLVESVLERADGASGGMFSYHYIVQKNGDRAFLKAFDFSQAFEPGVDTIKILQAYTSAFENEREILLQCKERKLKNVVLAIDQGETQVPGFDGMNARVFYLIFELADGDVRGQVDTKTRLDTLWCVRALQDVCLGLNQVHIGSIAHQDTKPSNVLIYKDKNFRIADFGRSSRKGRSVWYDEHPIAGDRNYAPPEQLYAFVHPDFSARRIGCDLYMFGNLVAFMFTGVNITTAILANVDPQFHWKTWRGTYEEVLPQLNEAFGRVLEAVDTKLPEIVRTDFLQMLKELCNPDLTKRGHPRSVGGYTQYSLERYVSKFDIIRRKVEASYRHPKPAA